MIYFLFAMLSLYSAGYLIRRAVFFKNRRLPSFVEKIGLDIGFGSGALALVFFYISFTGISLSRINMMAVGFFFIIAAASIAVSGRALRKVTLPKITRLKAALIIVIGICAAVIFFKSLYYPMYEWASRSIFGIKAKVLYETKTIYDKDLLDKEFLIEHPEYPLLIPMLENWIYTCIDSPDDRFGKGFLPFLAVGFLCSLYAVQRKFRPGLHSLIFTALYATLYVFVYRSACGEADGPIAFYYFMAGAYALLWIRFNKYPYLVTSSIFTAIAMFTKLEGAAFFAIIAAAILLAGRPRALFAYIIPVVVILIPWMVYKRLLPQTDVVFTAKDIFNPGVFDTLRANFSRIVPIAQNFIFDIMLKTRKWNLFWVIFFVMQIFYVKELFKKPLSYLAFMVWATLGTYLIMFLTIYLEPAHMYVTMDRFALQVSGLALLLMSLLASESKN